MRILKSLNVQMDRTVRIALWSGEEEGLLGSIAWVEFVPDTPQRRASPYDHTQGGTRYLGGQRDALEGTAGGAPVRVWLGPAELAAVDALIKSGIATSRADVIRWAVSRARENRVTYDRT